MSWRYRYLKILGHWSVKQYWTSITILDPYYWCPSLTPGLGEGTSNFETGTAVCGATWRRNFVLNYWILPKLICRFMRILFKIISNCSFS